MLDETSINESKYEIMMPYVIRGLLMHLMNDILDLEEYSTELQLIVQYLEIFLNSDKEVSGYLERYLTQISKPNFEKMVRRLQQQITSVYDS